MGSRRRRPAGARPQVCVPGYARLLDAQPEIHAREFVQQPAAQLPWFHLCTLLDKLKDTAHRDWYAAKAVERGWSRSVLTMQIETAAHARAGNAVTNFTERL